MIDLRAYQRDLLERTAAVVDQGRRVVVQAPTGAGKTRMAASMADGVATRGGVFWFVVHRRELIDQSVAAFEDLGLFPGKIAARYPVGLASIQVCSIQTLDRRLDQIDHAPTFICTDECHRTPSASYTRVLRAFPDVRQVGLTATPIRLDGRGLDSHYDEIVEGPTTRELIDQGYLSPYRLFAPPGSDTERPAVVGDAVEHYRRIAPGERFIVFCPSVVDSLATRDAFIAAGFRAAHVDSNTGDTNRRDMLEAFAAGVLHVLCNVDLFGEGVDVPATAGVILRRRTDSLALYLQQAGRALRTAPGKSEAFILDHAGNSLRHGLPDDPRNWSLQGIRGMAANGGNTVSVRQCSECYRVHAPAPACPDCGFVYPVQARPVEVVNGELVEVDLAAARQAREAEHKQTSVDLIRAYRRGDHAARERMAHLVRVAQRKGYPNAIAWAARVATSKRKELA